MAYTPGLWLFILASIIIGGLLLYSWQFRTTKTGQGFIFLMLCALIWVTLFTLETAEISLQGKLFFVNLEFLGITFLPIAWVFLVFAYTGQTLSRQAKFFYLLIPTLTNIVIWTNPLHHWFMGNPQISQAPCSFSGALSRLPILVLFHSRASRLYLLILNCDRCPGAFDPENG